jgi:hypothetical protein
VTEHAKWHAAGIASDGSRRMVGARHNIKPYEACPVLKAATAEQRSSRLALCALTVATLERGLGLLGISVPARM